MQTTRGDHLEVIQRLLALREAVERALEAARARWEAELEPGADRAGKCRAEQVAERLHLS